MAGHPMPREATGLTNDGAGVVEGPSGSGRRAQVHERHLGGGEAAGPCTGVEACGGALVPDVGPPPCCEIGSPRGRRVAIDRRR